MTNKQLRLDYIRQILSQYSIRSQEQLMQKLVEMGYNSTQATLSRDLQQLRAVRTTDQYGVTRYVLPTSPNYTKVPRKQSYSNTSVENAFLHFDLAGEMIVLHTLPGFAGALAGAIDGSHFLCVAGTLAGDDTVLVIGKKGFEREDVFASLREILPQICDE